MALLERVTALKNSGMSENQIVTSLKEEGHSPREISEALSQSKIKSAISLDPNNVNGDMQPSISNQSPDQEAENMNQYSQTMSPNIPSPAQQAQYLPAQYAQQTQYAPQDYSQQQYNDQGYNQQDYYTQGLDIETVRDIAKQEIEEGLKKIRLQLDTLTKSKAEMNFQVQNIENRLQKIESIIHELQSAIIKKLGEYGEAVSNISNELQETQKSFSKVINPLLDKKRGISEQNNSEATTEEESNGRRISSKPSSSVEEYFR